MPKRELWWPKISPQLVERILQSPPLRLADSDDTKASVNNRKRFANLIIGRRVTIASIAKACAWRGG